MIKQIAKLFLLLIKIRNKIWSILEKRLFEEIGNNVFIGAKGTFSYDKIKIGNNVFIGERASFISAISQIEIGDNVMFGPNVTIRGGNHRIDKIGEKMINVREKLRENDENVIIEEDVWIGCNVTILKGVIIGKGSVVGAGSVVTKNIPKYSIYTGVPEKKLRKRWNEIEVQKHEKIISMEKI